MPRSASSRASGCCCSAHPARASRRCCTASPACSAATTRASRPASCSSTASRPRARAVARAWCCRTPTARRSSRGSATTSRSAARTSASRATRSGRGCATALDAVGLDVPLDRSTSALSGGQKQRLALAGVHRDAPGRHPARRADREPRPRRGRRGAGCRGPRARCAPGDARGRRAPARCVAAARRPGDRARAAPTGRASSPTARPTRCSRDGAASSPPAGCGFPASRPRSRPPPAAPPGETLLTRASRSSVARVRGIPVAGPLDLEVRAGEVLGVIGPNGAGKSTLGLTLAGLHPAGGGPGRGIRLCCRRARSRRPIAWPSRALLTRIGTVFQDPEHQLLTTTVRAELEVGPRALGLRRRGDRRARRRAARAAAAGRARRGEPLHALGRREAAADRRGGARDAAARAWCSMSPPSGRMPPPGPSSSRIIARLRDDGRRDRRDHARRDGARGPARAPIRGRSRHVSARLTARSRAAGRSRS